MLKEKQSALCKGGKDAQQEQREGFKVHALSTLVALAEHGCLYDENGIFVKRNQTKEIIAENQHPAALKEVGNKRHQGCYNPHRKRIGQHFCGTILSE
jgi:hypothetical protein